MWNVKSSCRRILHQFVEVSYKHNTEVTAMDLAMELWSPVVIQLLTRIPESPPSHPSWKGNGFCPSWIVLGSSACSDYALFWTLMWTCYVAHTWCRIFRLDATVMVSIWGSRSNLDYERNIVWSRESLLAHCPPARNSCNTSSPKQQRMWPLYRSVAHRQEFRSPQ